MTTTALSATEVRGMVAAAIAAPSVMNTQPWRFAPHDNGVDLWVDRRRQLAVQDEHGRAMVISCGAALLNLRVAAAHLSYDTTTTVLPDPQQPDLLATVTVTGPHPPTGMSDALFTAIFDRHTNRGAYEDRPVPRPLVDALVEAAGEEGATLHVVASRSDRQQLVSLLHDADLEQESRVDRVAESSQWVSEDSQRRDGVPVGALGPLPMTASTPFRDLALGKPVAGRAFAAFEQDPTLAVLTTVGDTVKDWVVAGQALQRVLLVATVEGLVSTFTNQALEEPSLRWLVRDTDSPIGYPQMIMRLGFAPPAPATPRRPIDDVLLP